MEEEKMKERSFRYGAFKLGDARQLVKTVPDGSVDLIFTDPPFGFGKFKHDVADVFFELEDELWRVAKDNAWLVFYWPEAKLPEAFRLKRFKYRGQLIAVHFKPQYATAGVRYYTSILVFSKGKPKRYSPRVKSILTAAELPIVVDKVPSPLFKPTAVNATILGAFTREGDVVLDPFAGYGSIPIVCELFKRRWIAFEIDEDVYDYAVRAIEEMRVTPRKKAKKHASGVWILLAPSALGREGIA